MTLADAYGNLLAPGSLGNPFLVTGAVNCSALNLVLPLQSSLLAHSSSLVYR